MMHFLQKRLNNFIREEQLFTSNDRLVVGVSGGLDSVVLCHLLKSLGYTFELAHMNFGLRGDESERDELFVRNLGEKWNLPVHVKKQPVSGDESANGLNIQETAREFRYEWFNELLNDRKGANTKHPNAYILTAHHANDQAETILMNWLRGSGLGGLKGMLPKRGVLCRPLLFAERKELADYAREMELEWVEDSSNLTDKYTRNKIRQKLIPVLEEIQPTAVKSIYRNSRTLQSLATFVDQAKEQQLNKLIEKKKSEQWLPIEKWKKMPGNRFLLFAWLEPFGFTPAQLDEAIQLMESQTGARVLSPGHQLLKNRNWLILADRKEEGSDWVVLDTYAGSVSVDQRILTWKTENWETGTTIPADPSVAVLDLSNLELPFLVRKWKSGDYFYPLGLRKKKKIARFLTDQKLSRIDKENTWVLEAGKKIAWVLNQRLDDRFKVSPGTRKVMVLQFH